MTKSKRPLVCPPIVTHELIAFFFMGQYMICVVSSVQILAVGAMICKISRLWEKFQSILIALAETGLQSLRNFDHTRLLGDLTQI